VVGREPSTTRNPGLAVPMGHGTYVGVEGEEDVSTEQPSYILDILAKGKGGWPRNTCVVGWILLPGRPEQYTHGGGSTFTPPICIRDVCACLSSTHTDVSVQEPIPSSFTRVSLRAGSIPKARHIYSLTVPHALPWADLHPGATNRAQGSAPLMVQPPGSGVKVWGGTVALGSAGCFTERGAAFFPSSRRLCTLIAFLLKKLTPGCFTMEMWCLHSQQSHQGMVKPWWRVQVSCC